MFRLRAIAVATLAVAIGLPALAQSPSVGPPRGERDPESEQPSTRVMRVFKLMHRTPAEAFPIVQPLLSAAGSVTVAPRLGVLTVQDEPEILTAVEEAIRQFDVAPRLFQVQVSFYRAVESNGEQPPKSTPGPRALAGLGRKLADLLRYTDYDRIDEIVVTTEEGGQVSARMGEDYHIEFSLEGDPLAGRRVRLRSFQVDRIRKEEGEREQLHHVFRTSLNLTLEQPFVLGATRDEKSRTALMIVLLAKPFEPEEATLSP